MCNRTMSMVNNYSVYVTKILNNAILLPRSQYSIEFTRGASDRNSNPDWKATGRGYPEEGGLIAKTWKKRRKEKWREVFDTDAKYYNFSIEVPVLQQFFDDMGTLFSSISDFVLEFCIFSFEDQDFSVLIQPQYWPRSHMIF